MRVMGQVWRQNPASRAEPPAQPARLGYPSILTWGPLLWPAAAKEAHSWSTFCLWQHGWLRGTVA